MKNLKKKKKYGNLGVSYHDMSGDQDKSIQNSHQRTDELSLINFSDFTIMKLLSKGTVW